MAKKRNGRRKVKRAKSKAVAPRSGVPPGLTILNGPTIAAGESLSDVADCTLGYPVRITMPTEWTGSVITIQISTDGLGYNDLFYADGGEVQISCHAGTAVLVPEIVQNAVAYIKIRSGTRQAPVKQNEQRTFAMTLKS